MYNIKYEENLRHKYIKIYPTSKDISNYELKAIKYCQIPGIPSVSISDISSSPSIIYDISEYESLLELIKNYKFKAIDILIFLNYLDIFLESIEEYLLPYEITALNPKLIFYDEVKRKYIFTVIPGSSHPIKKDLNKILLFFLENIDISSDISILTAYKIYILSKEENIRLRKLITTAEKSLNLDSKKEILDQNNEKHLDTVKTSNFTILYPNQEESHDYLEIDLDKIDSKTENDFKSAKSLDDKSIIEDTDNKDYIDTKDSETKTYNLDEKSKKSKILDKLSNLKNISKKNTTKNSDSKKNILNILSSSIIPYLLIIIIFPLVFYFVKGKSEFLRFIPFIIIVEIAVIFLYIFNLAIKHIKESDNDNL